MPSSDTRTQRMDRNLRRPLWAVVFLVTSVASQHQVSKEPQARVSAPEHPQQKTRRVAVTCHPDSLEVLIHADMFDIGLLVEGEHLRLGSSSVQEAGPCGAVASGPRQFSIHVLLTQCGTKLSSTQDKIVYSNVLIYSPGPSNNGLLRLDATAIPVECHYDKVYAVNSVPLLPSWVSLVSEISAQHQIDFTLQLLTDDGLFERGSVSYFLGEPIHMEVSIIMGHHMPLKLYADHCVATATPDAGAELRYDFINHHGCLVDAHLTNSNSRFLPRVENHSLRFSVEAFRFNEDPNNHIYVTCRLKAVPLASPVDSENRACSFIGNSWESVDGHDQACAGCDFGRGAGAPPDTSPPETIIDSTRKPATTQVPVYVQSNAATFHRIRPGTPLRQNPLQSFAWFRKREAVVDSIKKCGRELCPDDATCCAEGNHSVTLTCCRQFVDTTYANIATVTRKLSGVLILLLLFAVGYFFQRVLCSKSRQTSPEELPTATMSREPLVPSDTTVSLMHRDPGPSVGLPSYEECKRLPTYEETMRGDGRRPWSSMDDADTRPGRLIEGAEPTQPH